MTLDKKVELSIAPQRKKFKLCFVSKCDLGRSYIHVNQPFYKGHLNMHETRVDKNTTDYYKKLAPLKCNEKYPYPQTENQKYGWYEGEIKKKDPLLFHGLKLDQMLKENLMNFEKIRI